MSFSRGKKGENTLLLVQKHLVFVIVFIIVQKKCQTFNWQVSLREYDYRMFIRFNEMYMMAYIFLHL